MAGRERRHSAALGAAVAAALVAAGCAPLGSAQRPRPVLLTAAIATADTRADRVGVLLLDDGAGRVCTASVVDSPGRDLLVTAAHCVTDADGAPLTGLAFAPGYRDGAAPLGSWPVDRVVVDQHWSTGSDPEYDVAFLVTEPVAGKRIEDAVGGNPLGVNRGFGLPVTVTGYPNDHDQPITCSARTSAQSATQEEFDCGGFSDGTSGSPWLTPDGALVGVIGGYQQGGDSPDVSYSVSFDDRVSALYQEATA
ncbi:trypsin-like peptidase domain-containing protein [Kitasatospora sp. NBC_01287]|uniref:trypsin-like serine peptidase n=1 Tax=Kitasatospora sp. NBC_01287 TaxID=2903573 RepID=UPI002250C605|nr:trypsin-like peptidase domain-containing protein [Kitasatospora sp. NBC_01287]MCX4749131.1 trypsin-like peptidase domain-containing protein [Kitasatospora sp. NBC_01287]